MGIVAFNSFTQVCIRPCLCVALFFSIFNSAQADFELTSVEDLRYGSALYKYYLNDYLGAMAELQIAKQKGGIKGHGVNPNIMEGGIAMSYAMPKYAIDIFNVLLEENRSQKAQDSAWFYLAKLAYEQGKWKQVSSLLEKINSLPHESLQKDINTLQINTLLQLNDPESALSFVNNSVINFDELPFIYFNLGGAFARQNNHNRALTFFKKFKDPSFQKNLKTNEEISLYNQAMVAAGYSSLAVEQYAQAVYYFKSVQVNSHLKNKALLGYGWAEIAMNQPEEAIKPWLLLNESNYLDEYQLESGIAIPYAYERQGNTQQALEYYKVSEVKLLGYLAEIEIIKSEIEKVGVIQALNIKEADEYLGREEIRGLLSYPDLKSLIDMYVSHSFHAKIFDLQDFISILNSVNQWKVKLNFYLDVVDRREYLRKNIEKNINFEEIDRKINELSQLHDDTINNLAHIKQKYDYYELASESEKELISRVNRSVNNLKILKDDLFFDEYKESIRRYQGLLIWSAMDDFNVKAWEVDKIHRFNDKAINSILYKYKNINKIKNEIKDIDKLKYKIGRSLSNIENLEHDIITVISKYEKDIYKDIKKSLIRKKNNIEDYLIQVRVSIARMEDKRNKIKENTESNNISQSIDQYGQNSINNDAESKEHIDKGGQNKEAESLHLFSVPSLDSLDTPELQEYIK